MPIGQYYEAPSFATLKNGIYPGVIVAADVRRDGKGTLLTNQNGKNQAQIKVALDGKLNDRGEALELSRVLTITFGMNRTDNKWSQLAVLIEICTGIPCGDKRQETVVEFSDLVGKPVKVATVNVENNGTTYTNIDSFWPPDESQIAQHAHPNGHPSTTPAARSGQPGAPVSPVSTARPPSAARPPIPANQFGKPQTKAYATPEFFTGFDPIDTYGDPPRPVEYVNGRMVQEWEFEWMKPANFDASIVEVPTYEWVDVNGASRFLKKLGPGEQPVYAKDIEIPIQ